MCTLLLVNLFLLSKFYNQFFFFKKKNLESVFRTVQLVSEFWISNNQRPNILKLRSYPIPNHGISQEYSSPISFMTGVVSTASSKGQAALYHLFNINYRRVNLSARTVEDVRTEQFRNAYYYYILYNGMGWLY